MIKDLRYLGKDKTHIHGPIPADLDSMQQTKYLSNKLPQTFTQFYDFSGTSPVVVGFTHILILMLKGLTKYLSYWQVYF